MIEAHPPARHILFDLDGTLTDSAEGILNCVSFALGRMERPVPPHEELLGFVGPPLEESFRLICGLPPEDVPAAVALYRERFSHTGIFENRLYPGVPALLKALQKNGASVHLATAKPQPFAQRILAHFGIAGYFASVHGPSLDAAGAADTKACVIAQVLREGSIPPQSAQMVGDRRHDMEGARANGVLAVGVLYGYGDRSELEAAGADVILQDLPALARHLLG